MPLAAGSGVRRGGAAGAMNVEESDPERTGLIQPAW